MFDQELRELNKSWLMLARAAARSEPEDVAWRLNMDRGAVEWLAGLSLEDIEAISACGVGLFSIRIDEEVMRQVKKGDLSQIVLKKRIPFVENKK